MAYLDYYRQHSLPLTPTAKIVPDPEPTSILFCRGPEWSHRYQINRRSNYLDTRFMYKDQGPPTYRKLGAHHNMYKIPLKTDHSNYATSFHYEPRMCIAPSYQNDAIAFPPGPPPPQVAMFDGLQANNARERNPAYKNLQIPSISDLSLKAYDKYRYLPGPPPDTKIFGPTHVYGRLPRL